MWYVLDNTLTNLAKLAACPLGQCNKWTIYCTCSKNSSTLKFVRQKSPVQVDANSPFTLQQNGSRSVLLTDSRNRSAPVYTTHFFSISSWIIRGVTMRWGNAPPRDSKCKEYHGSFLYVLDNPAYFDAASGFRKRFQDLAKECCSSSIKEFGPTETALVTQEGSIGTTFNNSVTPGNAYTDASRSMELSKIFCTVGWSCLQDLYTQRLGGELQG